MQIKDYRCKCGYNDFFFADKGNQKGIYCSYCGKWLKWADKDEQNLAMKQEPTTKIEESNFSQEQYLADIQSAYDCGKSVLDKIRDEIQKLRNCSCSCSDGIIDDIEDILDKYKAESEG